MFDRRPLREAVAEEPGEKKKGKESIVMIAVAAGWIDLEQIPTLTRKSQTKRSSETYDVRIGGEEDGSGALTG